MIVTSSRFGAIVDGISQPAMQLAIRVHGAADAQADRLRRAAFLGKLAEAFFADWCEGCELRPAAHAIGGQGLGGG